MSEEDRWGLIGIPAHPSACNEKGIPYIADACLYYHLLSVSLVYSICKGSQNWRAGGSSFAPRFERFSRTISLYKEVPLYSLP